MIMKHLIIKFLSMVMVAFLSSPALSADLNVGDVVFCTSDIFYGIDGDKSSEVKRFKNENFKFNLTKSTIKFGSSGYFSNSAMPVKVLNSWSVTAQDEWSTFEIDVWEGKISFYYASANPFGLPLMRGNCDKF